jgi:hypothetical protein
LLVTSKLPTDKSKVFSWLPPFEMQSKIAVIICKCYFFQIENNLEAFCSIENFICAKLVTLISQSICRLELRSRQWPSMILPSISEGKVHGL